MQPRKLREVPIVVLAGSDRRPGPVPEGAEALHFVAGYKGAELRVGSRALAQLLVERVRASRAFGEVYLAGPRSIYREEVDCRIIDTDGHLGENLKAAVEAVQRDHGDDTYIAFLACDILPEASEISDLASRMVVAPQGEADPNGALTPAASSAPVPPPALLLSVVEVDRDLGASSWKPKYAFRSGSGEDFRTFLPGHLGVAYPPMLRMGFVYRLLHLVYQERNRDFEHRRRTIVLRVLGALLWRDFLNLFRLAPPTLTYTVLRYGLGGFLRWKRRELDLTGLAENLAGVLVRRRCFRRWRADCVRVVPTPYASFAKDVDTREELEELESRLRVEQEKD